MYILEENTLGGTLFCEALNRGDGESLSALYEETAVLIFGGTRVTARKNICSGSVGMEKVFSQ